ncbi:hypothetical protein ncot_18210 [Nocardioides sp. JQ2195]|uniref:hypothetical protein n=1 Tax=Nocardioides sp. JQ2195 TaxID=2592334 RepID=UPI00143E7B82|nr:hypothetical protein [Nocardioides sp. JQ2195]QIX28307.1 hypothetical protein ncot_18210 [Nocardioides sp. JQ2195]
MNDLRDLRETLHSHADLHDTASTTRAAAIHDRVRGVRRRRRAVVGGAVVAAVAAIAVGLNLPDSGDKPEPANGLDAPSTIKSLGYTYELESTTTHEHRATVKIPRSDQPVLVAWGTAVGADDPVRVDTRDGEPFTSADDAFKDFYIVHPGHTATISVSGAEGDVSLATYSLGAARPRGVTKDRITFRSDVEAWNLVEARIGDLGAHEVTFDVKIPTDGMVRLASLCMGLPKGLWVNTSIDGRGQEFGNSSTCDDSGFDPAAGSYTVTHWGSFGKPGDKVRVRMWVSRSMEGEEPVDAADLADLRLGQAFYTAPNGDVDAALAGFVPDPVVESGGRTWRQTQSFMTSGTDDVVQKVNGAGPHLVMVNYRSPVIATFRFAADGREIQEFMGDKGSGGFGEFLIPLDSKSLRLEIGSGGSDRTRTAVGIYERVD